jgi:putative ABC transport system substrate-binding protein
VRRREFILAVGSAVAWPPLGRAQQAGVKRVGVLMPWFADDPDVKARRIAFQQEFERLGWTDERKVQIDYRYAGGRFDQYLPLAQALLALQPDVILASTTQVTTVFQRATRTVPVVFNLVSDPIGAGFIASLARPGGNLTGTAGYEEGVVGKWLAMLKEIAPALKRVAVIANAKNSAFGYYLHAAETAAPPLGIELLPIDFENADADVESAIRSFAEVSGGGLLILPDVTTITHRNFLVAIAARYRLPAVYPFSYMVTAGGLMSYSIDQIEEFKLSASYVDRILRGAKPADLPVQAPTKYQTVVNLKTAKALGLDVPASLLVRADQVIE